MSGLDVMFAKANLPEIPGVNANAPHTATHFAPAFVCLVAFCVLVIGYLIWDVLRRM